jgi:hypothetical protein
VADGEPAPSENPFDQIDPNDNTPAPAPAPAAPVAQDNQPAEGEPAQAAATPYDDLGEVGPGPSTAKGAFARGAEKSVLPAATSLAGAGAGGAAIVGIGAAAGTSVGPWGTLAGALAGGIVGGYGGSYLQNLAISHLPDSWRDTLGVDDRTARLDEAQHGTASFLGGLVPFAVTMHPSTGPIAALPKNATAMQQIMANPATSRVFGGALNGGVEIAQEKATGQDVDWKKAAISTAFGMVFNRPNKIGETITEAGAHPTRSVFGTPHPTVAQVGDLKIMGPGVTEEVFQGTQEQAPTAEMTAQEHVRVEREAIGEHPEPDLHGVARQMEPEMFAKYDDLIQRRETFRAWHGEGPGHDMAEKHLATTDAEIREMEPNVQAAYRRAEETMGPVTEPSEQFPSFAAMLAARESETGRAPNAGQTIAPEAAAAQETAQAGAGGGPSVPSGGETSIPVNGAGSTASAGVPVPQRAIGEQRQHIAADVAQKLIAAGRTEEEAKAAGQLIAARYVTRAGRFEGKLGSPEELYAKEAAAIGGANGKALEPAKPPGVQPPDLIREAQAKHLESVADGTEVKAPLPRGRAAAPSETWSLFEALSHVGGIKPDPELEAIFGSSKGPFVPGFGPLVRKSGVPLDEALRIAKDRGYMFDPSDQSGAPPTLTPRDLLDRLAEENSGRKQYQINHTPETKAPSGAARTRIETELREELRKSGHAGDIDPFLIDRTAELISEGRESDVMSAYERAIMETQELHEKAQSHSPDLAHDIADYFQDARGKIHIAPNRRPIIQLMKDANASTFVHESGHQFLEEMIRDAAHPDAPMGLRDDAQTVRDWLGVGGNTFKTAKGSTYEVHPDGTTTRNKAARSDVGHEGDSGPKARSAKTIYLDTPEMAGNLTAAGLQGLGPKGARVIIKDGKASLLTWNEKAGKWGIAPGQRDIPFTTQPGVGKAPLEVWKPADDVHGYEAYRGMHAGNPITEMAAGDIKTKHHEKFARGFEQYVREGVAPSPELAGVFAKFRNWLLSIYQSIKGLGTEISPDIRAVFDRMLEMEPQRTVVAPERASPTLLHDIHEAEAKHIPPHEAEAAHDRIVAESNRHLADQHPEIQNEIQAAVGRVQNVEAVGVPEQEPGAGDIAGKAIPSGAGAQSLVEGSGGPGAEPAGGAGGAEHAAVKPGGTGAGAESAGASGPDTRAKLGDSAGTALAPGPRTLFGDESPYTDRAGNIRLDTLNTSDDVKKAIRAAAAENNDFVGDRRGVVTDGQVMDLANDIGMAGAESLVAQHVTGQAFNAEQVVALRKLLRESAANVSTAAKKFAASGSDEDVLAFAQAKDRLQMVQKTVAGVTAEAGRALRAFRTLPGEQDTKAIEQMVAEATGKTLFQLKQQAKLAAAIDTPQNMNKFMQNVDKPSLGGMVLEGWINGLLSGPSTQVANIVSNAVFAVQHFGPEKAVSALVGGLARAVGREGTYTRLGEVSAAAKGVVQGAVPAALAAGESFKKGATGLLPGEEAPASGILEGVLHDDMLPRGTLDPHATVRDIQAAVFATSRGVRDAIMTGGALLKAGGIEGSPFMSTKYAVQGAIPDIQIKGMNVLPVGTAIRSTGRFLATADTFAAALNYSASINGIAYRMASDEGLAGSAFSQRIAQLRNEPTPEMMQEARGVARSTTFMDKGGEFVRAINNLTSRSANLPLLGRTQPLKFVAPFTNVVSRILEQTIIKRTPLGILSPQIQADLLGKNGNIAQDTAAARMLIGSAVLLGFGALASEGYITGSGPKDPKENAIWRLTNQPHSVKVGASFYQVQKLGPLGMLMGMAADLHDIAHIVSEGDFTKAGGLLFHAIVQNTLDQSALQGPAELIKAVETPDQYGQQYIKSFLSSFVPSSVNWIAKSRDPYIRQTWGVIDAIKARIPGQSETLHPKIDLWGEPVPGREQLGGMTGIYMQKAQADPVNKAMADLGMGKSPVSKKVRNVELDPEQYEYFARTSGRMAKMRLNVMVKSPQWDTFPAYMKMKVINETIDGSRRSAEGLLFAKWPRILVQARDDKMTLIRTGKKAIH